MGHLVRSEYFDDPVLMRTCQVKGKPYVELVLDGPYEFGRSACVLLTHGSVTEASLLAISICLLAPAMSHMKGCLIPVTTFATVRTAECLMFNAEDTAMIAP